MYKTTQKETTINDILPEIVVKGIDYSLLTQREMQLLKQYDDLRQELKQAYPKKIPEDYDPLDYYEDEIEDGYDLDIGKAKQDHRASRFQKLLLTAGDLLDKIDTIKALCTVYEIHCLRFYCKYLFNYMTAAKTEKRQKEINQFLSAFRDSDIYEIVEAYFKICRKYGLEVYEEPYYWTSPKRKRDIKHEGEMLKRSTLFDENEIRISLLEEMF